MKEHDREIVVCSTCKGVGMVQRLTKNGDIYVHHGKPVVEPCPTCDGTGRLLRIIYVDYQKISDNCFIDEKSQAEIKRKKGFLGEIFSKA